MTLDDLIELLLDESRANMPHDIAITRAVVMAYELGLEAGRKEEHTPTFSEEEQTCVHAPPATGA